jgi:long-chain fatty acid transport protein
MKTHLHYAAVLAAAFAAGTALPLLATGVRLPDQDAFATGRGEAFVATADNPSAIYYNPAGITQLEGNNLRAGIYGIYLDPSYSPAGGGPTFDNEFKYHAIPQFYYTYGHKDWPVSFGLGSYSPFGFGVDWPQNTGFRTLGIQGKIVTETINPVVAFKLSPALSLGGGVMVNYAKIKLQQGIFPYPSADSFQFNGDGWDVGYNLGLLWQPVEKLSFGAAFRSGSTKSFEGQTETVSPYFYPVGPHYSSANVDWPFPLEAVFGVSYRPTPEWNLEFNADYADWSAVGTVNLNQAAPPPFTSSSYPIALVWQSSWYFEWGVTRYFARGWHASAGYIFNQNSVPDAHYTPLVADLDRHFFSVGIGRKGQRFDFDVAYQIGYGTRTVTGYQAQPPFYESANGSYKFISHAIAMSGGWHF